MEEKYKCPVCGEYFFDKYDDYTECPVCGRGNCADQNENPNRRNDYNHMSLSEAYKCGEKVK